MDKNKFYLTDVLDGFKLIEDNSVDIILIDPPYNIGKDFGNCKDNLNLRDYIKWSILWLNESIRCLKDSGTIFVYGYSEILCYLSVNFRLPHRWLIWSYTNKNTPNCKFWQKSHESILVAWKSEDNRIFNIDDVREEYTETFLNNAAGKERKNTKGRFGNKKTTYIANEKGALPRDVIKIPALAGGSGRKERFFYCKQCNDIYKLKDEKDHESHVIVKHPTQKPSALTEKLLLSAKPKNNGFVLIPFSGTGCEGLVAKKLGMDFIGFDINNDYILMSNKIVEKQGV